MAVLLILGLASTFFFGLRTYGSFVVTRSASELGIPEVAGIRAWMTLSDVATTYRLPAAELGLRLGLPADTAGAD